jgi:hypothetical protein
MAYLRETVPGGRAAEIADSAWLWTEALSVVLWALTRRYGRTRRVEVVGSAEVFEALLCRIVPMVGTGWT